MVPPSVRKREAMMGVIFIRNVVPLFFRNRNDPFAVVQKEKLPHAVTSMSMKLALAYIFSVAISLTDLAQGSSDWTGTYEGYLNGSRTTLTLDDQGGAFTAQIVDDTGYTYNLKGTIQGDNATGELHDPAAGGTIALEAARQADSINMKLYQTFLEMRVSEIDITYTRAAGDSTGATTTAANTAPAPAADLDARLVGTWRYTSTYVSGDFSVASDYTMIVNADGTYQYGDARIAGGGSSGTFDSGSGGDVTTGRVMTQNKQLFVDEGYGWQFYANYMCDGAILLLTFQNGNKQIWERIP